MEGDTGPEVTLLQTRLNQLAAQDSDIPTVTVDGVFDCLRLWLFLSRWMMQVSSPANYLQHL